MRKVHISSWSWWWWFNLSSSHLIVPLLLACKQFVERFVLRINNHLCPLALVPKQKNKELAIIRILEEKQFRLAICLCQQWHVRTAIVIASEYLRPNVTGRWSNPQQGYNMYSLLITTLFIHFYLFALSDTDRPCATNNEVCAQQSVRYNHFRVRCALWLAFFAYDRRRVTIAIFRCGERSSAQFNTFLPLCVTWRAHTVPAEWVHFAW